MRKRIKHRIMGLCQICEVNNTLPGHWFCVSCEEYYSDNAPACICGTFDSNGTERFCKDHAPQYSMDPNLVGELS